jgi:hypothetical protein
MISAISPMEMSTSIGLPEISFVCILCLIVLLSASVLFSSSKLWSKDLSYSLNLAILPLFVTFIVIVGFMVFNATF